MQMLTSSPGHTKNLITHRKQVQQKLNKTKPTKKTPLYLPLPRLGKKLLEKLIALKVYDYVKELFGSTNYRI